jgi:LAS superfamily LD-carboxypeptidase LdcB
MDPVRYLTGKFDPARQEAFVELSTMGFDTGGRDRYLRKEAARALAGMVRDFNRDHPAIAVRVRSATRNFHVQKWIWESKWTGRRNVEGKNLAKSMPDLKERGLFILRYSSMPGTSRHHWGTDVDLNSLTNRYFDKGEGRILYDWLREHAADYGFCQPYTAGRKQGYEEEKWHWSYLPLAKVFLRDWMKLYNSGRITFGRSDFRGSESCGSLAPVYVRSIAPACLP